MNSKPEPYSKLRTSEDQRMSASKPNFSENIFQMQKKKIRDRIDSQKQNCPFQRSVKVIDHNKLIVFNDHHFENRINWKYATFNTDILNNEECPEIKSNWTQSDLESNIKGIEIRNLVFMSKEEIDYSNSSFEMNINISMKGESIFWLILRSNGDLDENSSVLKISKEEKSQRLYILLGTYVKDSKGNVIFKIFLKQQLIDYSKIRSKNFINNDLCEIKLNIMDTGEDKVFTKVTVNDSKTENVVNGDFFLPCYDSAKVMIAGFGQSCIVKFLKGKSSFRDKINYDEEQQPVFSSDKRNCDCCILF